MSSAIVEKRIYSDIINLSEGIFLKTSLTIDIIRGWQVPGFRLFRTKRSILGMPLLLVLELTFLLGLIMKGGVVLPTMNATGGGVISLLTFVIQLGNGLMSLLSLAATTENITGAAGKFLGGTQPHALFELGGFYLLASGAMNYFAITNFYDRYRQCPGEPDSAAKRMQKE